MMLNLMILAKNDKFCELTIFILKNFDNKRYLIEMHVIVFFEQRTVILVVTKWSHYSENV